jgi:hypothetical protein
MDRSRSTPSRNVAVVGGRGGADTERAGTRVRHYGSPKDVGHGELVRLEHALRSGGIDQVVLRTRWNAHTVTARIRRLCRVLGIPVTFAR